LCFSLAFRPWLARLAYAQRQVVDVCTTYTYGDGNVPGSPDSITGPDGLTRFFGYDKQGNQYKSWYHWADANDPNSNYGTVTNLTKYDSAGRAVESRRIVTNGHGSVADSNVLLSKLNALDNNPAVGVTASTGLSVPLAPCTDKPHTFSVLLAKPESALVHKVN
jgi:hypothetical protein